MFDCFLALLLLGCVGLALALLNYAAGRAVRRLRDDGRVCPNCGYDIRATSGACPECGLPVVGPQLPLMFTLDLVALQRPSLSAKVQARQPEPQEKPVRIYATDGSFGPSLLVRHLLAAGIVARLEKGQDRPLSRDPADKFGRFSVTVWSGDVARALAIIDRFRRRHAEEEPLEGQGAP